MLWEPFLALNRSLTLPYGRVRSAPPPPPAPAEQRLEPARAGVLAGVARVADSRRDRGLVGPCGGALGPGQSGARSVGDRVVPRRSYSPRPMAAPPNTNPPVTGEIHRRVIECAPFDYALHPGGMGVKLQLYLCPLTSGSA